MAKFIILFVLMAVLLVPLTAEVPEDSRSTWRIGVAEFRSVHLSSENVYIGSSLPLLIYENIARIEEHQISSDEREGYAENLRIREVNKLRSERDLLLLARDAAFLAGKRPSESAERLASLDDEMNELLGLDSRLIAVAEKKPVEMVQGKDTVLLPRVVQDPKSFSNARNLDLLIFGVVEEIESYLFVDIHVYEAPFDAVTTYSTAFSRERLTESTGELFDSLIETALGRSWGVLEVRAVRPTAGIYIDGDFAGLGTASLEFAEPGDYVVTVSEPAFIEYREVINLSAGEDREVLVELVPTGEAGIAIVTEPPGADLYALSQWYGTTPVMVPSGLENIQGLIKKEGYSDFLLPALPAGEAEVRISLLPDAMDRTALMSDERKDYYRTFAAFILSLPLPIYFLEATNTLTLSYNEASQPSADRNSEEISRLLKLRQANLSAYVGTLFISGALFIDAMITLLGYIDLVNLTTY